ncbi:helix-turn-helix transcriptional regulator [Nocardia colli]|uniref:Helix-turn-helix transcriptional regulator n=1 Tax=Nocardia colli TaxID=2545717 RepID=A0A5N0E8F5_9NOCA|nr:helix-turn-helix domain-containing protein [Nocardia colli]KAA8885692.1 helix-turn-helix transcriptional regulator [Nocardia colli]
MTDGRQPARPEIKPFCPYYGAAMSLLSKRWAGEILRALVVGPMRFGDFAATIPGITDRVLSQRLKDLEAAELVSREVQPSTPVRIDYRLTPGGEALGAVLLHLNGWALKWITVPGDRSHDRGS